jgi:hypothetical protein
MTEKFDIVICLGPNDINIINLMIDYTKKNIIGYRNIYIISYDKNIKIDGCIIIDETIFPFNKQQIEQFLINKSRAGWYLQQLLKLYACFIIDDILDNILIIDSDTIFFKKTSFFYDDIPLYNYGTEYYIDYFEHMQKLHPSLKKQDVNKSGISHHIIFTKKILKELLKLVENYHNKPFYQVFIENINPYVISSASEYEIYFNFMLYYFPNELKLRKLNFDNKPRIFSSINNNHNYDYISYHHYL